MAENSGRRTHPIRVIHLLGCLSLAAWFGGYAWHHHPLRRACRAVKAVPSAGGRPAPGLPGFAIPAVLGERLAMVQAALPDLLGGMAVLFLVSLGTGVYARRFEVWLEAHQAGEAASIRGVGLDRAALGANKDRKKGASL